MEGILNNVNAMNKVNVVCMWMWYYFKHILISFFATFCLISSNFYIKLK